MKPGAAPVPRTHRHRTVVYPTVTPCSAAGGSAETGERPRFPAGRVFETFARQLECPVTRRLCGAGHWRSRPEADGPTRRETIRTGLGRRCWKLPEDDRPDFNLQPRMSWIVQEVAGARRMQRLAVLNLPSAHRRQSRGASMLRNWRPIGHGWLRADQPGRAARQSQFAATDLLGFGEAFPILVVSPTPPYLLLLIGETVLVGHRHDASQVAVSASTVSRPVAGHERLIPQRTP